MSQQDTPRRKRRHVSEPMSSDRQKHGGEEPEAQTSDQQDKSNEAGPSGLAQRQDNAADTSQEHIHLFPDERSAQNKESVKSPLLSETQGRSTQKRNGLTSRTTRKKKKVRIAVRSTSSERKEGQREEPTPEPQGSPKRRRDKTKKTQEKATSKSSRSRTTKKKKANKDPQDQRPGTSRAPEVEEKSQSRTAKSAKSKKRDSKQTSLDFGREPSPSRTKLTNGKLTNSKKKRTEKGPPGPTSEPSTSSKTQDEVRPSRGRSKKGRICSACGKALTWNYLALNCSSCPRERCRLCLDCPCQQTPESSKGYEQNMDRSEAEPSTSRGKKDSWKHSKESESTRPRTGEKRKVRICVVCARKMHFNYRSITCHECERERCRDCRKCLCQDSN